MTCLPALVAVGLALVEPQGGLIALRSGHHQIDFRAELRIPARDWETCAAQRSTQGAELATGATQRAWSGRFAWAGDAACRYEQTLEERDGSVHLRYRVAADSDLDVEGVFLWIDLPTEVFAGGACSAAGDAGQLRATPLPVETASPPYLVNGTYDTLRFAGEDGQTHLVVSLDRLCNITLQDNRHFGGDAYSLLVPLAHGAVKRGDVFTLSVVLHYTSTAVQGPVTLVVRRAAPRYRFAGFGGNFCFGLDSPVAAYTLNNLQVAWGRTQVSLDRWEPENDDASPHQTDHAALAARDLPGTPLRREFAMARGLQERGIPYCASVWRLPGWLGATTQAQGGGTKTRLRPSDWPELLECIGSYLLHARQAHGVEPDLFSFNEPDIGVNVLLSADEHRDAIRRVGAHLASLGLRTRQVLGDTANARGTVAYARTASADPAVRRFLGAVAFHSWGGATPGDYADWSALAAELGLPLLVSEVGVDPDAWRTRAFETFHYGLREVCMYQELLLQARPASLLQWELSENYPIVVSAPEGGAVTPRPTARYWLLKHFFDLTPPGARVLTVASDDPRVLITAFAGESGGRETLVLHIVNLSGERQAHVLGLPAEARELHAVRTSRDESFRPCRPVRVRLGRARVMLAPRSLLTLSTARR